MVFRKDGSAAPGFAILLAVALLPLVGAVLAGRDVASLLQFPPSPEIPLDYPRWSWLACAGVLAPFAAIASEWTRARRTRGRTPAAATVTARSAHTARPFPPWGWVAAGWTIAWWVLAWTRWRGFAALQHYTFFPLWLGFVVTVNALTLRACGTCLMTRAPRRWLALFAASAAFWWVFEWLNRFVGNWHYLAAEDFSPRGYVWHATVCFSTVLPAVTAVSEWLATRTRWQAHCAHGPAWPWFARRTAGIALLAAGASALVLTGARPQQFYPALWGAPLALALGQAICARRPSIANEIAAGDWRRAATWALAALICGFFWEMWNAHSLAKWIYTVPYVDRAHLFEMPALGYFGYLPFGLECLVLVEWLFRDDT
jgi:hypothetical protein